MVGDFNAKVGCKKEAGTIAMWDLGGRNESGQRLIDFCKERNLSAANAMFDQPKRRLYTWTSPNQKYRNQIDYILCRNRWRSSVIKVKIIPGADCGSDHELIVAKVRVKLRKREKVKVEAKFDTNAIPYEYTIAVENWFAMLDASDMDVNEEWAKLKEIITTEAVKHVPKQKRAKKAHWLTENAVKIAEKRRKAKAVKSDNCKRLCAEFQKQLEWTKITTSKGFAKTLRKIVPRSMQEQ